MPETATIQVEWEVLIDFFLPLPIHPRLSC
jgi:hypothetical protein